MVHHFPHPFVMQFQVRFIIGILLTFLWCDAIMSDSPAICILYYGIGPLFFLNNMNVTMAFLDT